MLRQRHQVTALVVLASDLVVTLTAFLAAWYLRFESGFFPVAHRPEFADYLRLLPVIAVVWPVVFYFHGLFQFRRDRSRVDETLTLIVAVVLASVLLSAANQWIRPLTRPGTETFAYFDYSRLFLVFFAVLDVLFIAAGRSTIRQALRAIRLRSQNLLRILVVGAGALGREVVRKLLDHRDLGLEVVGFLDDDPSKKGEWIEGVPVLADLGAIDRVLAQRRVDQVYLALPLEAHRKMLRVLQSVARECVEVRMVPDILQYATLKATLEDLDGTPVINLSQVPLQGWASMVKRSLDLAITVPVLAVLLPFLPPVALAIWLEDRGSVFYRQERMGLDGRSFQILKFRSMRVHAEATTGPVWAIKDDPRRTVFGGWLRRWSLDELPQLWNVLKGEMSIVGPRPERPAFVHEFKEKLPQYMVRHRVKSGITGWAQVHGWRGNTSIRKRLQYDLYYIENWSLRLDLKILWLTVRHGLRPNAY